MGVDLGVSNVAVLSDGKVFGNDHEYKRRKERFEELHRSFSKHRCSPDNKKHLSKLQHAYKKMKNHRNNTLHGISKYIAEKYETIFMEDLSISGLRKRSRSRSMTQSYDDASLGRLTDMICYKSEDTGHTVRFVDPRNTSQICSGCGCFVKKDLSVRVHQCPRCGLTMDRDLNAARNIHSLGLAGNPFPA